MAQEIDEPQTLVEMVLVLLQDRFPSLGANKDEDVSGADTVQDLSDLHDELLQKRAFAQGPWKHHKN